MSQMLNVPLRQKSSLMSTKAVILVGLPRRVSDP
jgi:hypothetical protein